MAEKLSTEDHPLTEDQIRKQLLLDYKLVCVSRETSLLGRKEVLTGKAKFGIFGDGKEVAQIALAKQFQKGDFRSGYYRDQTLMMALGLLSVKEYFAALYAHTDVQAEPSSGGRQMGGHFATRNLNSDGSWKKLTEQYNSSSDVSPTASQMPRLVGLAQASKIYKNNPELAHMTGFSRGGNEIAFGTIGDASTSEGLFWESMNAACVLEVPMLLSVWDDGFGISVPKKYQTVKESISVALSGFSIEEGTNGLKIFKVKGWDYPKLLATYEHAASYCRTNQNPVLVHVEEVTQPQGHSTSGSHERYKSKERLDWAAEYDCIAQMAKFIVMEGSANQDELDAIREKAKKEVRSAQKEAWAEFRKEIDSEAAEMIGFLNKLASESPNKVFIQKIASKLESNKDAIRKDIAVSGRRVLRITRGEKGVQRRALITMLEREAKKNLDRYSAKLYSDSQWKATAVEPVPASYDNQPEMVDGRLILRDNFEKIFEKYPEVLTFGEDTGVIGGVNQSMEGMQEKFGELRVSDTGIREATIIGQGIGLALRGLRPIAEIQYLDYLYYCLQLMRDDLSTVQFRTSGGQKAPLIIRTRGHRLEGIWHSGSAMGAIMHSIRGMNFCVPRNMTQAAGMYNTLLCSDEPALVVECLNGYRKKESMPNNLGEFKVPLGIPEIIEEGSDITLVSYGSTLALCQEAVKELSAYGIEVELVDIQTLLPFDIHHILVQSLEKTSRLLIVDEDVPGGASAFILDHVINKQSGFRFLDSQPLTLTSKEHLPAYGTDGDYFSKPNVEDIFDAVYSIMNEVRPADFPEIY